MMIGRSKNLAEQLDAVLDGRVTEVPDELAPLVALANELRDDVAGLELRPEVAEQHLNLVYRRNRAAAVASRAVRRRQRERAWRRRAVSVAFAAILLLVPATFASGSAMPGDPLYPLKRGIEKVRLAAALSPDAEAEVRSTIADVRLEELQGLLQAGEFGRVPDAILALQEAILDAQQAVAAARARGADSSEIAALESRLNGLREVQDRALASLPPETRSSIVKELEKQDPPGGTAAPPSPSSNPTDPTSCPVGKVPGGGKCVDDGPGTPGTDDPGTSVTTSTTTTVTTTTVPPSTEPPQTTDEEPPTSGGGRGGDGGRGTDETGSGSSGGVFSTLLDLLTP